MAVEHYILGDVLAVALIALVLGLGVHAVLRWRNPEMPWGTRGNVWAEPYSAIDLLVMGVLLLMFGFSVWGGGGTGDEGGEDSAIDVQGALYGIVFYVFLLVSLLFFLGFVRTKNVVEMFGLARMSALKVAAVAGIAMLGVFPLIYLVVSGINRFVLEDTFGEVERQDHEKERIIPQQARPRWETGASSGN